MNELISIIVPVYKAELYLDKCVASIINQTYKNLEIILVDDGSPDNCPKMCDDWAKKDKRIKVIHKKNGGVSSARNDGLKVSSGNFICFVDSDDEVYPEYCEKLYNALIDYNSQLAICGSTINEPQKSYYFGPNNISSIKTCNDAEFFNLYNNRWFLGPCNKIYKKEFIKDFFDKNLNYGEDTIFNLQYCSNIDCITTINCPLYVYNINNNSLSTSDYINTYKKRAKIVPFVKKALLKISNNERQINYYANKYLVFHIFYTVEYMIKNHFRKSEILAKLDEISNDKFVQEALIGFVPLDKKSKIIWNAFKNKKFKKLIMLAKIKLLLNKILKR